MNMNKNEINESQKVEKTDVESPPAPNGVGITGDTTTHDLIMTRLWIKDEVCENVIISVLGAEFTKSRAQKIEKQVKGKRIDDTEFVMGLKTMRHHPETSYPLDALLESVFRALDNYHRRKEQPQEEKIEESKIVEESKTESTEKTGDDTPS